MNMFEPDYEPSELDGEVFLSDAPLSLLMQGIENQFQVPTEYQRKDYVQSFITKYEYCREREDEETKDELDEYYAKFVRFMCDLFDRYLGIGFPAIEDMKDEDALDLIHMTYRFFIKNIKSNFRRLVNNYVEEHKAELTTDMEERKDVTFINFKGQIENEEDVLILSNLSMVVQEVLTNEYTVDEFLELVDSEDFLERDYVSNAYDRFLITGNFVPMYIEMTDEDLQQYLETKLRNKILSNYGNRKKIKKIIKDGEEVDDTVNEEDLSEDD